MNNFFKMFSRVGRAREIGSVTDWLVGNSAFRNMALGFHKTKTNLVGDVEKYLDRELLGKKAPREPLHINTKGRNTSSKN